MSTCPAEAREGCAQLGCASWQALGSSVELRVCDPAALAPAREAVQLELDAIDLACSRFRADSELVSLNARAGRCTRVSPLLLEALGVALRAAELTDGDVDPTVGRALELAGYDRDWAMLEPACEDGVEPRAQALREPAPRVSVRARSGWRTVELDARSGGVHVPRGISLDLGASAKAWAADRGAAAAASAGGCGALLALGGDLGTYGEAPPGGWQIHVTDDHRSGPTAPGQRVRVLTGGLATSSIAVRRWRHDGRTMHHIIDPASGRPAETSWRTVSVAAANCTDANIAATAAIVRDARAPAWLAQLGLPARLVNRAGEVTTVAGWPQ